ncbi:TorD/DmsD family molecular chaperone [Salisediminibacterium beveridgei]|uniref:Cytoplasmic chaperone TorD n=1 Tax=Salisediminibacterium beveridgei TaxID=632773 RepID=A0A1D7QX32_9BACI|nr:molecular chaperone TorD family protein [Salisediminibacterium beveridgei]AOM83571.1 Cytoplasmic chaperone TorD [Salisediminibacterium beveridgei]
MVTLHPSVNEEMIEDVQEVRQFYYEWLTQLFIAEPTEEQFEFIQQLIKGEQFPLVEEEKLMNSGIQKIRLAITEWEKEPMDSFEAIHWDYTRMFIGPFELPAPPWASAYRHDGRMLFQEETVQVRKAYAKYGHQVARTGQEAEDHIGFELDFMSDLVKDFTKSFKDNPAQAKTILQDQIIFLEQHLHSWIAPFTKDIREASDTLFYEGCADLLEGWLTLDRKLQDNLYQAFQQSE